MTQLQYNAGLTVTDPQSHPVLIVGQLRHLNTLKFSHVSRKLEPRVSADTFERAVASLHPSPTDFCPLYLNVATVMALPVQSSRHNTNSRAHALTRLVKTHACTVTESIVVSCVRYAARRNMFIKCANNNAWSMSFCQYRLGCMKIIYN